MEIFGFREFGVNPSNLGGQKKSYQDLKYRQYCLVFKNWRSIYKVNDN